MLIIINRKKHLRQGKLKQNNRVFVKASFESDIKICDSRHYLQKSHFIRMFYVAIYIDILTIHRYRFFTLTLINNISLSFHHLSVSTTIYVFTRY